MVTSADDLTQMLEDKGIAPLDNLAVAESMCGGIEQCSLMVSSEDPVNTIAAFMEKFSDIAFKQPDADIDTPTVDVSLTNPTGPS